MLQPIIHSREQTSTDGVRNGTQTSRKPEPFRTDSRPGNYG